MGKPPAYPRFGSKSWNVYYQFTIEHRKIRQMQQGSDKASRGTRDGTQAPTLTGFGCRWPERHPWRQVSAVCGQRIVTFLSADRYISVVF
jgi:hypothetical protein